MNTSLTKTPVGPVNAVEPSQYKIMTIEDILADITAPPPPIIGGGVLLGRTLLLIYGKPKSRKTFLGLNMAVAIAQGKSFAGFTIDYPKRVLVLSAEGGYFPLRDRLQRMCITRRPVADHLQVWFNAQIILNQNEDYDRLVERIKEFRPEVLVIDPLVRFHNLDENHSTEMTKVMRKIRSLIEDHHLSVILTHHTPKATEGTARGSSVIMGEYDSAIQIGSNGTLHHELAFDMRHVETPDNKTLQFDPDTFWFEDPTVSPVVKLLLQTGPIPRPEAVSQLKKKYEKHPTTIYRWIDSDIELKRIAEDGENLILLN